MAATMTNILPFRLPFASGSDVWMRPQCIHKEGHLNCIVGTSWYVLGR